MLHMTVGELGRRMTSAELNEWRAFLEIRPAGEWAADYRTALIVQSTRGGKVIDHMPYVRALDEIPADEPVSDDELAAKLHAVAAVFAGDK